MYVSQMVTPAAYLCPPTYKYKLKVGCNGDVSENKFRKESIDILTRPTNKTTRVLYICVCVCVLANPQVSLNCIRR